MKRLYKFNLNKQIPVAVNHRLIWICQSVSNYYFTKKTTMILPLDYGDSKWKFCPRRLASTEQQDSPRLNIENYISADFGSENPAWGTKMPYTVEYWEKLAPNFFDSDIKVLYGDWCRPIEPNSVEQATYILKGYPHLTPHTPFDYDCIFRFGKFLFEWGNTQ